MSTSASEDTIVVNESCPLTCQTDPESHKPVQEKATPVPKAQLAALCIVRLVDPITFTQLFPYVNEFMSDLHLTDDPSKIGFYSGLVESAFAVAQLCSIYHWARSSDIMGRRPVILLGVMGIASATVMFGLAQSLGGAVIARCLSGLFSGNIAVIHSMLGEITDSTNQAVVFPIYGLVWPLGSIIGPLIGGTFSHPARKFPEFFDFRLFRDFPYLLPCLIAGLYAVVGVIFGYTFLEETLPSKRSNGNEKSKAYGAAGSRPSSPTPSEDLSVKFLMSKPAIRHLATSGSALSFIATAFDVVFVLFCYSPIKTGGLAFSDSEIGFTLAAAGVIGGLIQLFCMPYLLRTFDSARMYYICMAAWPYTFAILPLLSVLAQRGLDENGHLDDTTTAILWIGISIVLALSKMACVAFSLSMILTKENSPTPTSLGRTNGIIQFAICFARAFAPFLVSSLFALSTDNNLLGGHLWAVIMVVISFGGAFISKKILYLQKDGTGVATPRSS